MEVLSPTTEQEDRGNKWQHYQHIPSLQEFVLVSRRSRASSGTAALASGDWVYQQATAGVVQLPSGVTLDLARLYADLPE